MQSTKFDASLDQAILKTEEVLIKTEPIRQPDSDQDIKCSYRSSKMQSSKCDTLDDQELPKTEEVLIKTEPMEEPDDAQLECDTGPTEYILPDCSVPIIEYDEPIVEGGELEECDSKQNRAEFKFDQCSLAESANCKQSRCSTGVGSEGGESGGTTIDRLQQLARIVDGRKTYFCQQCQYKTTNKPRMRNHLHRHFGERPFECSECPVSCVRNSDLNRHMLTHSGLRPHKCPVCSFRCGLPGNLRRHMSRAHKRDTS